MLMKNVPEIQIFLNRFHTKKMKNKVPGTLVNPESSTQ